MVWQKRRRDFEAENTFDNERNVFSEHRLIKMVILEKVFDMLDAKEQYLKKQLQGKISMISYDKWLSDLVNIYDIIKSKMNDEKFKDYKDKTKVLDWVVKEKKRLEYNKLCEVTEKVLEFLEVYGITNLEWEREKPPELASDEW